MIQANRLENAPLSKIREVVAYANKLEAEGKEIIHLEMGEPDFSSSPQVKEALIRALDQGMEHYAPIEGLLELRKAICRKLEHDNGVPYTPDEILVTNGVAEGIFLAFMAFLNPGDEVLIPDPCYLCYITLPNIAGAVVRTYPLDEETNFQVSYEHLLSCVSEKTKMIVLISPNNPTGSILNENSLKAIAKVAEEKNLLIVADEIYEKLIYGKETHVSIASLPDMKKRTILLNGFSKYYAMTGWRVGYMALDKSLYDPVKRLHFYNLACVNTFVQSAALAALEGDQKYSEDMRKEYEKRRDYLVNAINEIPGLCCSMPSGAFYIFMNISDSGMSADAFCQFMLDNAGVAMVPGSVFGEHGSRFVRLSYATSMENLQKSVSRISKVYQTLRERREENHG